MNTVPGVSRDQSCETNAREIQQLTGVDVIVELDVSPDYKSASSDFNRPVLQKLGLC